MMMGPPPRAERGEVKYLVLDAIKDGPTHGYEVMQTIEERSRGRYRPSPGTVYPTLQMLEEMGLASCRQEGDRKLYEITEAGRVELAAYREEIEEIYARFGSGAHADAEVDLDLLEDHVNRIIRPVGRAIRSGRLRSDQLTQVLETVDEAADRIERILRGI